jgi:hypothetical protein
LCRPAIAQTATTTTLSVTSGGSAATTVAQGSVVTLTATATAGSASVTAGTVNFCDATALHCTDVHIVGTAQLTRAGTAVFRLRPGVGSHSYKAVFAGTRTYGGSSSTAASLTVQAPAGGVPTTTTVSSGGTGYYTLSATVSAASNDPGFTGTVSFLDASNGNAVMAAAGVGANSVLWVVSGFYDYCPESEAESAGVTSADFNGDGIPDLAAVCAANGTVGIFLGNGDGTFTQKGSFLLPGNTGGYLDDLVAGDFNGDGIPDLAVTDGNGTAVYLGNGDGTFTFKATSGGCGVSGISNAIAVADFNQDGILDLAEANGYGNSVTILLGNGDGTFSQTSAPPGTGKNPAGVAVGDFNGDGFPDLAVTNSGSNSVTILLGNGDGTFTPASVSPSTGSYPLGIVAADFNGNGTPDLAVANSASQTLTILFGNGDGTFTPAAANLAVADPYSVIVADFNGDGIPDLAVSQFYGSVNVLLGKGDGTFTAAVNHSYDTAGQFLAAADFNGSGLPGLATNYDDLETVLTEMSATAVVTGIYVVGSGTYQVTASYPGNSTFAASTSTAIALNYASTAPPAPPTVSSPTPGLGTVLGTSNVTFRWMAVTGYTLYQLNLGTVRGGSDLYLYKGAGVSVTVPSLPANGVTVYARLYSYFQGAWLYSDNLYTESSTAALATLTTPTPGLSTKLGTSNVAFQWTAGTGVSQYQLNLSTVAPGGSDLFLYNGTANSATVPSVAANGTTVYARLYSYIKKGWQYNDSVYTESGFSVLTSPTPGLTTTLGTSNVTFQWTAGKGVRVYRLNLGTFGPGAQDLYVYEGTATSVNVPTLPADGVIVYATLASCIDGAWYENSYVYIEGGTTVPAALSYPTPGLGTVLSNSGVPFRWSAGTGVTLYELTLGTVAPGSQDLYLYKGTATFAYAPSLPANGETVYARLSSYINNGWQHNDYVYTESGATAPAVLSSPTPGVSTVLGVSNVEFQWTAGNGVTLYQLNLSAIAPGESDLDLYKGAALSTIVPSLPANGVTVYARLYSYINKVWQYNDYVYTEQQGWMATRIGKQARVRL